VGERHKVKVEERCSLASHYTLTTGNELRFQKCNETKVTHNKLHFNHW